MIAIPWEESITYLRNANSVRDPTVSKLFLPYKIYRPKFTFSTSEFWIDMILNWGLCSIGIQ